MSTVAYLGPAGTFTHQAARDLGHEPEVLAPLPDCGAVLDAVAEGTATLGIVPFTSSRLGEIPDTFDRILRDARLYLVAERVLPVTFHLLRRADDATPLREVRSHPAALRQCQRFLSEHELAGVETASTAAACAELSDSDTVGCGAIGAPIAAELYGLATVERGIEDEEGHRTRFVAVAREPLGSPPADARTALSFPLARELEGALADVREQLKALGLPLLGRHTREAWSGGADVHFLEVRGVADARVVGGSLEPLVGAVRLHGSFPDDPARAG